MSSRKKYLTKKGLKKLKEKYNRLLKAFKEMKSKGKIPKILHSEDANPEYISFQEDLNFLEARIARIEEALANAEIVEKPPKEKRDEIRVGATVKVEVDGKPDEFTIVGSAEADPPKGKISYECPVGEALLGHKEEDKVEISSPTKVTYKIKEISYDSI